MAKSASRGASKNASANSSSKGGNGTSLIAVGFVLGIAATLGGQWLMQSGFQNTQIIPNNQEVAVQQESASQQNGEESYQFYELLSNLEVAVPETNILTAEEDNVIYWLQASSFRDPEDAEDMRVNLILGNMEAQVKPIDLDGAVWHRVMAGPFESRTIMNKAKEDLVAQGINPITLREELSLP